MTISMFSRSKEEDREEDNRTTKHSASRDFEAENLIVIAKRAQQEQEKSFPRCVSLAARFCAISLPASFFFRTLKTPLKASLETQAS